MAYQKKNKVIQKTRRGNGEGSLYKQKNGLWTGKIWVEDPMTNDRKRKTVYGKSEAEVAKKMVEIAGSMSPLNSKVFRNKTFGQLFEEWILVFKKSAVSPRTFEGNIRNFNLHIKPFVGNMNIAEVTAPVVQQVINEALVTNRTVSLARKLKFLFNQFFEYAIDTGFIEINPTSRIKIRTRNTQYENKEDIYKAIPQDERMKFLEALNQHEFLKPLCMTMMFAGLRTGETLALKWQNVDFENKTISIRAGIIQVPTFNDKGKVLSRKTVIGTTKTACSVRIVPMPEKLLPILENWKEERWVMGKKTGCDLISLDSLVFGDKEGNVRTYYGTSTIFQKFIKSHGLSGYGLHLHGLRQTFSNILFENNVNPKVIQMLLGHKDVKTTIMNYNSVDQTYFAKTSNIINNSL